jgi:hypothetical protein
LLEIQISGRSDTCEQQGDISELEKEIKFVYYLLKDIRIEVDLPIILKTDNISAMFRAQNASSSVITRPIYTRNHFAERTWKTESSRNYFDLLRIIPVFSQKMQTKRFIRGN